MDNEAELPEPNTGEGEVVQEAPKPEVMLLISRNAETQKVELVVMSSQLISLTLHMMGFSNFEGKVHYNVKPGDSVRVYSSDPEEHNYLNLEENNEG